MNCGWFLILSTWIMLHIAYCLPLSQKIRLSIATIILTVGALATLIIITMLFFFYAMLNFPSNNEIVSLYEIVVFLGLVIWGPFIIIFTVRGLISLINNHRQRKINSLQR
jgi:uncharacterized membrane protein